MTNWFSIFYWLTVADGVKSFFNVVSNIGMFFLVISLIIYIICSIGRAMVVSSEGTKNEAEDKITPSVRSWVIAKKLSTTLFFVSLGITIIMWAGYVATPTKKDCLLIIAGGAVGNFITTDSTAKHLPSDITMFLHMSLKKEIEELGEDAKREFGVQTPKEKLLDKVKKLSKEELVEYLKNDTTLIK